jgi:hypothetical protein
MMGLNPLGSHLFQLSKNVLLGIAATLCILTHIIPEVEEWHVWLFDDDGVPIHSKAGEEGDNFAYDFHQERMEENYVAAVKDSNVEIFISFPLFRSLVARCLASERVTIWSLSLEETMTLTPIRRSTSPCRP